MNCNKICTTTSSPLWLRDIWVRAALNKEKNVITGALLDALHPLTPWLFIKGEFLRVIGIYLWLAEIITLKALMRPAWASKFLNLYEFLNSWGVNTSRWESGQLTCICQPLGSQQLELQEMMWITGHPFSHSLCSFQPHFPGRINSSRVGYNLVWLKFCILTLRSFFHSDSSNSGSLKGKILTCVTIWRI